MSNEKLRAKFVEIFKKKNGALILIQFLIGIQFRLENLQNFSDMKSKWNLYCTFEGEIYIFQDFGQRM